MLLYKNKEIIIKIISAILFVLLLILILFPTNKPEDIIKQKLHLVLPSSAKILRYNYNRVLGDFDAKIQINKQDVEIINSGLKIYFVQEYNGDYIPNFQRTNPWWDMDDYNLINSYVNFVEGKQILFFPHPKTQEVWAFIVQSDGGDYYLYISYL